MHGSTHNAAAFEHGLGAGAPAKLRVGSPAKQTHTAGCLPTPAQAFRGGRVLTHLPVQLLVEVHVGLVGAQILDAQHVVALRPAHAERQRVSVGVRAAQPVDQTPCRASRQRMISANPANSHNKSRNEKEWTAGGGKLTDRSFVALLEPEHDLGLAVDEEARRVVGGDRRHLQQDEQHRGQDAGQRPRPRRQHQGLLRMLRMPGRPLDAHATRAALFAEPGGTRRHVGAVGVAVGAAGVTPSSPSQHRVAAASFARLSRITSLQHTQKSHPQKQKRSVT